MSHVLAESIQPGQVIAGKYRVERVLGSGGMGTVVAAVHLDLDELRAVKLMHPSQMDNAQAVERFLREARATRRLKSEHVPMLYDVGRLDSGAPYMVMEVLEGEDLRTLLKSRSQVPIEEAVLYILQACEAIAEAHAIGIIHRDLKPANLFITRRTDGSLCVKVLDFGVSKLLFDPSGTPGPDMTKTLDVLGSIHYMAPEQLRSSRSVDGRADVFSLGVILYRLLTGRLPFQGDTPVAYIMALRDPLHPPSAFRSDLPPELDAVIMRALEKDPDRRTNSIAELMIGLIPFGPGGDGPRLSPIAAASSDSGNHSESLRAVREAQAALPPPPVPEGYDDVDSLDFSAETQPIESKSVASAMTAEMEAAGSFTAPSFAPMAGSLYGEDVTEPLAGAQATLDELEQDPSAFVEEIEDPPAEPTGEGGLFTVTEPAPALPALLAAPVAAPTLNAGSGSAARPEERRPPSKPISFSLFILLGCLLGALAGIIIAVVIVIVRPKPGADVAEIPASPSPPAAKETAAPPPPIASVSPPPPTATALPTEAPPATAATIAATAPPSAAPTAPEIAKAAPPPSNVQPVFTQARPQVTGRPPTAKKGPTPAGEPTKSTNPEPPRSGPIFE